MYREDAARGIAGAVLPLLPDTHPALRRVVPEIGPARFGAETETVADTLQRSMHAAEGIGLAANQVGLDIRAFAMARRDGTTLTLFNPCIVEKGPEPPRTGEEGCLSFPGLVLGVDRHPAVRVRWQDPSGGQHEEWMEGIDAICAQHEIDHLDGIVFTTRVSRLVLERARRRLAKERRHGAARRT